MTNVQAIERPKSTEMATHALSGCIVVKRAKSKRSRLLWHFAVSTSLLGVRRRSECWRAGHCLCDSLGSC